jgi:hypothetical protein
VGVTVCRPGGTILEPLALQLAAVRVPREVHDSPSRPSEFLSGYWMPEPRDARSIIENAEQAAAAGDYASAEDLLREATAVQEQTLGPDHPELANTLNNLGVVCEMTDNPIDAEHYFRRAYAIATATLAPDHPFVATSRKNLHDFCAARGRPVELPPSPPGVAAWLEASAPAAPLRESSLSTKKQDVTPIPRKRSLRPLALGGLSGAAVLIVLILMVAPPWGGPAEETTSGPAAEMPPPHETPTPKPTPSTAEPIAPRQPTAKPTPPTRSEADAVSAMPTTPARPAAMPTVVTAQLCTALKVWRCEAADSQVPPGPMFFYTQLKSATATTIEHRWYQGDRLRQAVQLRIQANPGAGDRTYSRNTISSERAGDWRVELRTADGTVLHEERFTVR